MWSHLMHLEILAKTPRILARQELLAGGKGMGTLKEVFGNHKAKNDHISVRQLTRRFESPCLRYNFSTN